MEVECWCVKPREHNVFSVTVAFIFFVTSSLPRGRCDFFADSSTCGDVNVSCVLGVNFWRFQCALRVPCLFVRCSTSGRLLFASFSVRAHFVKISCSSRDRVTCSWHVGMRFPTYLCDLSLTCSLRVLSFRA